MRTVDSFQGKACLVTGAASGIGRATALALGAQGARLVLTDLATDGLEQTVADVRGRGGTVLHADALDLVDVGRVRAFADAVHAEHGSMDVVLNIAGTSLWGAVDALGDEHWQQMVDVWDPLESTCRHASLSIL